MVREIKALIAQVDDLGGAVAAIEKGFIQKEIEQRAYTIQKEIEENKKVVVGLNKYQVKEKLDLPLFKSDPEYAGRQKEKLKQLRETRDGAKVQFALMALRKAAGGEENLMPLFLEAVRAYATLGEICGVLRDVFGEYLPIEMMK
jgi:methylmalonyl-CoA mutase N-terminal domain/subunit